MSAAAYNLQVEQGADSEFIIKSKNTDLAGASALMQIRRRQSEDTVLLELSTINGKIVIENGNLVRIIVSKTDSALLVPDAEYDLMITLNTGKTIKLLRGIVKLVKAVTR